jgi:hypothetical protein
LMPHHVPLINHAFTIISEQFAELLKQSHLTGATIRDVVHIAVNQSQAQNPQLRLLDITGNGGHVRRWMVIGEPDTCPFCHKERMVCAGCGRVNDPCLRCGNRTLITPDARPAIQERRAIFHDGPKKKIVEARDWDGANWFKVLGKRGGTFVDRKAKDWCERQHIPHMVFTPAILDVQGVEDRFK